jgi:hypothetical protein
MLISREGFMRNVLIIFFIALVLCALVFVFIMGRMRPNLKQFEVLKDPRISVMPDQKVLSIELKGDPNIAAKEGFGRLFKAFYALKRSTKGMQFAAPRARWAGDLATPKEQWVGTYAMPVPDSVEKLPSAGDGSVKLETWKYGEVAEILHIGSYGEETPDIEKLRQFIESKGYVIAGSHEEEYLKGPGMFFKGNPKNYWTIIRYQVKHK